MAHDITLSRVETVPEDARVHHVDELGDAATHHVQRLATEGSTSARVDPEVAAAFGDCSFLKFTDYYRVDLA